MNGTLNTTFPAFVTSYRIRYAQELMLKDPSMRMSKVAEESGFNNEKTFLRSFKAICGVTPSEWKQEQTPQTAD
jgi:two-component system response regulator YesN